MGGLGGGLGENIDKGEWLDKGYQETERVAELGGLGRVSKKKIV